MANDAKAVCTFCRNTGKEGASWLLKVPGEADREVHKPCGENAIAHAPEGVKATIVPSPALRARWQEEKAAKAARSFWQQKFKEAKPLKAA